MTPPWPTREFKYTAKARVAAAWTLRQGAARTVESVVAFLGISTANIARCIAGDFVAEARNRLVLYVGSMAWD
jgi:hypothetical protein